VHRHAQTVPISVRDGGQTSGSVELLNSSVTDQLSKQNNSDRNQDSSQQTHAATDEAADSSILRDTSEADTSDKLPPSPAAVRNPEWDRLMNQAKMDKTIKKNKNEAGVSLAPRRQTRSFTGASQPT